MTRALCIWAFVAFTRPSAIPGYVVVGVTALLVILALLAKHQGRMPRGPVLAYLGLAAASVAWAEFPGTAITSVLLLFASVSAACVLAPGLTIENFVRYGDLTLRALIIVSIVLGAALPSIGLQTEGPTTGSLIGLYPQRNNMGYVIVLGAVFLLFSRAGRQARLFWLAVYLGGVLWTGSQSTLAALLIALVLSPATKKLAQLPGRERTAFAAIGLPAVLALALWVNRSLESVLGLFGRDLTFSDRVEIWSITIEVASKDPWLGLGVGSAFDERGSLALTLRSMMGWAPNTAHNGFLSAYVQLGIIGLVIALVALFSLLISAMRRLGTQPYVASLAISLLVPQLAVEIVDTRLFVAIGLFLLTYLGIVRNMEADPLSSSAAPKDRTSRRVST